MKKFALLTIMMSLTAMSMGQHYWTPEPLQWSNFTERESHRQAKTEIICFFEYLPTLNKIGHTSVKSYSLLCGIDEAQSWRTEGLTDSTLLRYNQTMFDMGELICRQMQSAIKNETQAQDLTQLAAMEWHHATRKIEEQTDRGQNSAEVKRLYDSINLLLMQTPETGYLPKIEKGAGFGAEIGACMMLHFDNDLDIQNPSWGINLGLNAAFGRHYFGVSIQSGALRCNGKLRISNRNEVITLENSFNMDYGNIAFRYGYGAIETELLRLTPFVGIGSSILSFSNSQISNYYFYGTLYQLGASLDWRIANTLDLLDPSPIEKEVDIRLSAYAAYQHMGAASGFSINFSLSLGALIQQVR